MHEDTTPSCRGNCSQGDWPCPHADLCQEDALAVFVGLRNALLISLGAVAVIALVAVLWPA